MPSRHETFRLVYVEVVLHGLPVFYRYREGIDGSYIENIGEKDNDLIVEEIADKHRRMIDNLNGCHISLSKI